MRIFSWHSNTNKCKGCGAWFLSADKKNWFREVNGLSNPSLAKLVLPLGHFTSVGGCSTFFAALRGINSSAGSFTPTHTCRKLHRERLESERIGFCITKLGLILWQWQQSITVVLCMLDSPLDRMQLVLQPGHAVKFGGFMLLMRFSEKIKYAEGEITSKRIAHSMIYT